MWFSNINKSYLEKTALASIFTLTLFFASASVFAIATVPSTPTGLTAIAVSPTQVNLFWSAPASDGGAAISGYKIEYKSGSFYSTLVENTGTASTTYFSIGLTAGTTYTYKVSAINSIGTSTASSESSATPTSSSIAAAPGFPTGLVATAVSPTKIDLTWSAPSNNGGYPITGYKIQYRSGSNQYADLVANTASTTTAFSHNGITAGQLYVYRVYAITAFATSDKSSSESPPIQPKSASAATAPGAPTGLVATAVSPTKIDLTWSAPSNNGGYPITGYKIEYKKGTGSYMSLASNTSNSTTSYSHTGLITDTTYTYKVSAINSIGTSTASSESSTTPTSASTATAPGSPSGLTATAVSATQINLSWNAPSSGGSAITGYKIEYKSGTGSYSILANTASTTYSHTGLTSGTTYTYKVSAINSIGTSTASSESSATPTSQPVASTAPGSPSGLTATAVSATQINLSWNAPSSGGSAISGYKIEVKKGTGSYETLVANTASTLTTYSHTGLITGATYHYRVSAINSIGTGTSSDASAIPKETTVPTLTAVAISPTQISLSWTPPSQTYKQQINGYKVEEKLGVKSFKTINENPVSTQNYLVNDAKTGKTRTFVVSAVFGLGASPRSNEASATPTSSSVPPEGYTTKPQTVPKTTTSNDPNAALKAQKDDYKKKVEQAREELKKKPGKEDSEKAKAAREEVKKANEKARQDALAARQKVMAEKQAQLAASKNKETGQEEQSTNKKLTPRDAYTKTMNDARAEYEKIANDPKSTEKQKTDAYATYKKIKSDAKAALDKALSK